MRVYTRACLCCCVSLTDAWHELVTVTQFSSKEKKRFIMTFFSTNSDIPVLNSKNVQFVGPKLLYERKKSKYSVELKRGHKRS